MSPRAPLARAPCGAVHRDDLIAHIEHASLGDLTVCAVGISDDLSIPSPGGGSTPTSRSSTSSASTSGRLVTLAPPQQQRYAQRRQHNEPGAEYAAQGIVVAGASFRPRGMS